MGASADWSTLPRLPGEQLILEPLRVDHAGEMAALLDDPGLHVYIGGEPASVDELRDRYERQIAGAAPDGQELWLNWIVRRRADDQAVGYVQATVLSIAGLMVADVAWVIATDWQGRGYAREAARTMTRWLQDKGVTRFEAHIHPDHVASQRVAEAVGLRPTDTVVDGEIRWVTPH
jgi:RimJ/RimL family protein N-acetyltransferase